MITKKDLEARAKAIGQNPYNLSQKQLDEVEVTKAEVAEHLKTIDFSKHSQPTETELKADVIRRFSTLLKRR